MPKKILKAKPKGQNPKFQNFIISNAGQKPAEGWFLSKWVYNFWPAKNLCAYQDIHNGAKSSKP